MVNEMSWKECRDKKIIFATEKDEERSNQILKMAETRFEFWDKPLEEKFITLKIEAYYDIIKELIFSHIYKSGYNCTNHLCLIAYLKEKIENFDFEIQKIDELRVIRNNINYRGFFVKKEYLEKNELEIKNIIKRLKKEITDL